LDTKRDEKRGKRKEKRKKEKEEISRFREYCFNFLLKPWQSRTGLLPRLLRATYKTSQNKGEA
jgi:hypothetical protein